MTFEQVFKALYQPLCNHAFRYLKDADECEEVVQQTFFKFWDNRQNIEVRSSLKAYLYSSVTNACLNRIKHEKVKQEHKEHTLHVVQEAAGDDKLEQKELNQQIRSAIESLPERCRDVFNLVKVEGFKYKEAAEMLTSPKKQSRTKWVRHSRSYASNWLP